MFSCAKSNIKRILEIVPVIAVLGVITGFGVYTSVFGALIVSIFGMFFNNSLIYGLTIPLAVVIGSSNVYLGGKSETLFALIFMTGIFLFIFSFIPKFFKVPKTISSGFVSGCTFGALLLIIPLIFGLKTFTAPFLMLDVNSGIFASVDESSVISALLTVAFYYYFSKQKILPSLFMSVLCASLVVLFYKLDFVNILQGIENFKMVASADFGKFHILCIFAFFISAYIWINLPNKNKKRTGISIAFSHLTSAVIGTISGGVYSNKGSAFFETLILFIFVLSFRWVGQYIPLPVLAGAFLIYCCRFLSCYFKYFLKFSVTSKLLFVLMFLISMYSAIIGLVLGLIFIIGKYLCQRK